MGTIAKFEVEHLRHLSGSGGEYEIDVVVEMEIFDGARVIILVECKYYNPKNPVKRDTIMVLEAKLRDVAAHKGMIFSTSGFQRGAIEYAKAKGIATILVEDGKVVYETKDRFPQYIEPPPWVPRYDYIASMVSLTDEGHESYHRIMDGYYDAIREWLE